MRKLLVLCLMFMLSGCFTTKVPLFSEKDSVSVLPKQFALIEDRKKFTTQEGVRKGRKYFLNDKSEALLIPIPGRANHYHLQYKETNKEGKIKYSHKLVSVIDRTLNLYKVDVKRLKKETGITDLSRASTALAFHKSALSSLGTYVEETHTIYDLTKSVQRANYWKLVEEEEKKQKIAKAKLPTLKMQREVETLLKTLSPIDGVAVLNDSMSTRLRRLDFYKNVFLVTVIQKWKPEKLRFYYLYDGKKLTRLDGTSPPIHKFNAEHPIVLNNASAAKYLKFFSFFIRGEEGPFLMLNSMSDPHLPKQVKIGKPDVKLEKLVREIKCEPIKESKDFNCKGVVYYSNAIFEASYKIESSGMVDMLSDKAIAADLSKKIDAPIAVSHVKTPFSQETLIKKKPAVKASSGKSKIDPSNHYHGDRAHKHPWPEAGLKHRHAKGPVGSKSKGKKQ